MAEKSHKVHQTGLDSFNRFTAEFDLESIFPVPVDYIVQFIAFLSVRGYATKTIQSYVAAISYWHKISNVADPTHAFIVCKLIEGHKRLNIHSDSRLAITLQTLNKLIRSLEHVAYNKYETLLFQSSFILAFWFLLRVGELTCPSKNGPLDQKVKVLQLKDVFVNQNVVRVKIRWSKTDQLGRSTTLEIKVTNDNAKHFKIVEQFCNARGHFDGPFCCHFNKEVVTRSEFSALLKKCLNFIDIKNENIKSHSFRIGGATYLAANNMSDDQIKVAGRWKSNVYKNYIRLH